MRNSSLRSILFSGLLLFAPILALSQTQSQTWRDDPKLVEAARKHSEDVGHALGGVSKARQAMRAGHLDVAEALAETAAEDLFRLGGEEYPMEAREVLAELALRRNDYRESLRQAEMCKPRFWVQRFGMTRALALIGLGRIDEARNAVMREVGTTEKPGEARKSLDFWRYPLDGNGSVEALKATALMVRAKQWMDLPEAMDDLRTAANLQPNESVLHILIGNILALRKSFESARTEYATAQAQCGNDSNALGALRRARRDLIHMEELEKAKKAGQTPTPGSNN